MQSVWSWRDTTPSSSLPHTMVNLEGDRDAADANAVLPNILAYLFTQKEIQVTHHNAIAARHSGAAALGARAHADDRNGAAGQAQEDVQVAQVDTKQT